ncbi:hypothetical protein [Ralstonia pseudosolanacearum]|uniref:hypothetical protein n=1 Tax=Ralstonia pseudosolanacearum TaxID=1310165 RepID=UPI003CF8E811
MTEDQFDDKGVASNVMAELAAMRELGMNVPKDAEAYVRTNEQTLQGFRDNGMKYSEIADYVCSVA